jgi:predicted transcriptional regulator
VPSILVELDDATFKRLNAIAPAAKRQRSEFVRNAVREAIRKQEYARIRAAYERIPDTAAEADDWSNCEEYKS